MENILNKLLTTKKLLSVGLTGILTSVLLSACSTSESTQGEGASAHDNFEQAYQSFDIAKIKADVKTLSSDEFAGREPSTIGEKLTTNLLVKEFKKLGLAPGNGDSFYQAVPMVTITSTPKTKLNIADIDFEFPKNMVASSRKTEKLLSLKSSELVYHI
jgi:hypothetical protein